MIPPGGADLDILMATSSTGRALPRRSPAVGSLERALFTLVSAIGAALYQALGSTWGRRLMRPRDSGRPPRLEPGIYLMNHNCLIMGIYWGRFIPTITLISKHRDGELAALLAGWLGFEVVRGSSSRSASAALMGLQRRAHPTRTMAIAVDGPRGPRHRVKLGAIQTAAQSGSPLIPVGMSCTSWVRLPSWDQMKIPLPFSRADIAVGEPIFVPADADRETLEAYRVLAEDRLMELTRQLEALHGVPEEYRSRHLEPGEDPRPPGRRAMLLRARRPSRRVAR